MIGCGRKNMTNETEIFRPDDRPGSARPSRQTGGLPSAKREGAFAPTQGQAQPYALEMM